MSHAVLVEFLDRYFEDKEAGKPRAVEEYQALFPGHEELIRREFLALKRPLDETSSAVEIGESPFGLALREDLKNNAARSLLDYLQLFPGEAGRVIQVLGALDSRKQAPGLAGSTDDSLVGQTIGPYRLEKSLGQGGQAVVFLARDSRLDRLVALKIFSAAALLPGSPARLRFDREASLVAKLNHPGIVSVYEVGDDGPCRYIAMEYVEGTTLSALQHRAREEGRKGALALTDKSLELGEKERILEAARLLERLARAVHAAHEEGILHRDIKPGNIIVTPEGRPVLLDFGLSRRDEGGLVDVTQTGDLLGTPRYMSPEQIRPEGQEIDRRSDVYSLGATLYECVTGRAATEGETAESVYTNAIHRDPVDAQRLNSDIPVDLKHIIETAVDKDRTRRYATALDLAEDLERVRHDRPIHARPATLLYRMQKKARRNKILLGGAVSTLVASLIGTVFAVYFALGQSEQRLEARKALYKMGLHLGVKSLASGNPGEARDYLAEVPEELRDWEWKHLYAQTDASLVLPVQEQLELRHRVVGWSPQGTPLVAEAAGEGGSELHVREVGAKAPRTILGIQTGSFPVGFDRKGSRLAVVDPSSQRLRVLEIETARTHLDVPIQLQQDQKDRWMWMPSSEFSSDGQLFAAPTSITTTGVFNLTTASMLFEIQWPEHRTETAESLPFSTLNSNVAIHPDGHTLFVTGGEAESARLFSLPDGELLLEKRQLTERISARKHESTRDADWSPDGKLIALRGERHEFYLLDASTLELAARSPRGLVGESIRFLPDSRRLAVGRGDSIKIWDLARDASIEWQLRSLRPALTTLAPDSDDSRTFPGLSRSMSISPDGERINAASDSALAVFGVDQNPSTVLREDGYVYFVAWSPDGSLLATGGWSRAVYLWDPRTGEQLARLEHPDQMLKGLGFSPDGTRLIAATSRGEAYMPHLRAWDSATGEADPNLSALGEPAPKQRVEADDLQSFSSRFWREVGSSGSMTHSTPGLVGRKSRSGEFVATRASFDRRDRPGHIDLRDRHGERIHRSLQAFTTSNGRELIPYRHSHPGMTGLAICPDDEELVAFGTRSSPGHPRDWDHRGHLVRYDLGTGECIATRESPLLYALDFHPDGNRIAAAQENGVIAILDAETLETVYEIDAHEWYVHAVSFSPDGTELASASGDGTARIWRTAEPSERNAKKLAAARLRKIMRPRVLAMLEESTSSNEVAGRIRGESDWTDDERREALLELLRICESRR